MVFYHWNKLLTFNWNCQLRLSRCFSFPDPQKRAGLLELKPNPPPRKLRVLKDDQFWPKMTNIDSFFQQKTHQLYCRSVGPARSFSPCWRPGKPSIRGASMIKPKSFERKPPIAEKRRRHGTSHGFRGFRGFRSSFFGPSYAVICRHFFFPQHCLAFGKMLPEKNPKELITMLQTSLVLMGGPWWPPDSGDYPSFGQIHTGNWVEWFMDDENHLDDVNWPFLSRQAWPQFSGMKIQAVQLPFFFFRADISICIEHLFGLAKPPR